jgi:hypothetical protein
MAASASRRVTGLASCAHLMLSSVSAGVVYVLASSVVAVWLLRLGDHLHELFRAQQ